MKKRKSELREKPLVEPVESVLPPGWTDTGFALTAKTRAAKVRIDYRICNGWNPLEGECSGVEMGVHKLRGEGGGSPYIPNEVLAEALRKAGWTCTPPSR